jgi:hypothetical protein
MTRAEQKANKDRLLLKEIIDKMFEIAGHDLKYEDVESIKDNWYQQYTMTKEQNKEWRNWSAKFIAKKKRCLREVADREIAWIDLYCGLKISE